MNRLRRCGGSAVLAAVVALTGCQTTMSPNPTGAEPTATPDTAGALFYSKAGSLYVSQPAGSPGRRLTDGPADTQPAPSPDLAHVAFIRKDNAQNSGAYGGQLWVLDLSDQLTPSGPARPLVDPAALPAGTGTAPAVAARPKWSPTGALVAFIDNTSGGIVNGGRLLVATAATGELVPAPQPPFADYRFAWAPDGDHIAWLNARTDVSPVNVNTFAVAADSTAVATQTNAFSLTYGKDGRTILFTNGDASDPDLAGIPFALRPGGIYSVPAAGPKSTPTPLLTRQGSYFDDIAALESGGVAFTAPGDSTSSKAIQILDKGAMQPRTVVGDAAAAGQPPAWGPGDHLAYLDTSGESALVVTDSGNRSPTRVDTGVDSFAWAP